MLNIEVESEVLLGEIALIIDCEHKTAPATKSNVFAYSVGTRALSENYIDIQACKPVDEDTYKVWSKRAEVEIGDIIFAREAPVGGVGLVKALFPRFCLGQRTVLIKPDREVINPLYLNYLLQNREIQNWFVDMSMGSTVLHINVADIKKLPLRYLPSLAMQSCIAEVLHNIDLKIEGNASTAKLLEDTAQTIFKSWFIDFDPVKAKIAGEMPAGMDGATAALFPNSMEESELGLIPKGWVVSNLDSVSSVKYGAPFSSKLFNTKKIGLPLIRIRDLKKQSISTWSPENHPKGFLVAGGELLVGMDGEFNPTIWFGENALVNQRICKVEPKNFVSNFFLYFTLLPIMRRIEHGSTGSTVIHLGKTDIDAIKLSVPSQKILAEFKSLVEPLLQQMVCLNIQSRILQEARDSLLPRLISGELQIPVEMLAS